MKRFLIGKTLFSRQSLIPGLFILCFIFLLYLPALNLYLMGDDFECLNAVYSGWENPLVIFQLISLFFRPILQFSFLVKYTLFGTRASWYIASLIMLHLANVLLLYLFVFTLSKNIYAAGLTALLFGTSPRYSQAILWTGGHSDSLLCFFLLSIFILLAKRPQTSGKMWHIALLCAILGAIGAKGTWIILPLLMLSFLTIVMGKTFKSALLSSLFVTFLVGVYVLILIVIPSFSHSRSPANYVRLDSIAMLHKAASLLYTYLGLGHVFRESFWHTGLALLLVLSFTGILIALRTRFALWSMIWFGLTIGITLPVATTPSRYNYLPLVGFWMMVTAFFEQILRILQQKGTVRSSLMILLVILPLSYLLPYHGIMVHLEIQDYQRLSEAHRTLVQMYQKIEDHIPVNQPFVFLNAGKRRPIFEFARRCQGYTKYWFVRPTALWQLVHFAPLANFAGDPFDQRMVPISQEQIPGMLSGEFAVVLFTDQGFFIEPRLSEPIREFYASHAQLPETTGAYQRISLQD